MLFRSPGSHCPSLIRPPGTIAGPVRPNDLGGHFSEKKSRICMRFQKNRLTAIQTLNHLVRPFCKCRPEYSPRRGALPSIRQTFWRRPWRPQSRFEVSGCRVARISATLHLRTAIRPGRLPRPCQRHQVRPERGFPAHQSSPWPDVCGARNPEMKLWSTG